MLPAAARSGHSGPDGRGGGAVHVRRGVPDVRFNRRGLLPTVRRGLQEVCLVGS